MSLCKIYFIVDNRYAKQLLLKLIQLFKDYNLVENNIYVSISNPVNVCDNNMERYVKGAISDYDCIVILVDSEGVNPSKVYKRVFDEHVREVNENLFRVNIIIAHPCLESWLCEVVDLTNCSTGTCNDIIQALEPVLERKYTKKTLPVLMMRKIREKFNMTESKDKLIQILPRPLKELIEVINAHCTGNQL